MDEAITNRSLFSREKVQWIGFFSAPLLAVLVYALLPPSYRNVDGETVILGHGARGAAAIAVFMAIWWLTEAVHISVTALLPLVLLPLLQVMSIRKAASYYGHELIFLFMGGFFLSKAMERWGLHQRIALTTLRFFGRSRAVMVAGFMLVAAVFSMWVSNTATAIMMLPIAISVVTMVERLQTEESRDDFPSAVMLGVAYACSIGGVGTLIGSPPNLFLAGFIRERFQHEMSFFQWMLFGLPLVIVFLPLTWLLLTRVLLRVSFVRLPGGPSFFLDKYRELGPINRGSKVTFFVFIATALLWLTRPFLGQWQLGGKAMLAGLTDAGIAVLAGLLLFTIPVNWKKREFVLDWDSAVTLPWGILILFGGGLSLAAAVQDNGLGAYLGSVVSAGAGLPSFLLVMVVAALIIFLTELTSNTATTATMVPILAAIAVGLEFDPYLLMFPATLGASFAFMMPVATPPNAIVFGSGRISIGQMVKVGFWLNLIGVILVSLLSYFFAVPILESWWGN